jgi:hypothetical protein
VYISLPDYYHAGTTAILWMYVRQGPIHCTTSKPTWYRPDSGPGYYNRKPYGCHVTFDERKPVDLWLYSDSNNDVYVNAMGVTVGSEDKTWYSRGAYVDIDHDTNNGYWTTSS